MSDLISRSELLNTISNMNFDFGNDTDDTETIIEMVSEVIKEQPTAYDIDKVVEELNQRKIKLLSYAEDYEKTGDFEQAEIYSQIAIEYITAIEIVKQGGVADDVCEYKIKDKVIYASCNNKQIASAFCWFNECGDYKYCPYCGKKIKIEGDEVDE